MNADATYAQRAAARLAKLLDEAGYPSDLLGRSNALSAQLQTTSRAGQALLSGIVPWTWAELQSVCAAFSKEPGYFLDATYAGVLPSDTVLVPSSDGGEAVVVRLPTGFLREQFAPGTRLRYLTERSDRSTYAQGNLLIYAETELERGDVQPGGAYVVEHSEVLDVMSCQSVHESVASFEPLGGRGLALIVPLDGRGEAGNTRVVGKVIATIQAQ